MKNVKLALSAGFAAAVRSAYALIRHINPHDYAETVETHTGKVIGIMSDGRLDEVYGFDYWFAHQSPEVQNFMPEYAPGCRVSAEYFWRGVFAQLFCKYHDATWYASESPGPFAWAAASRAEREGKSLVVMEGLS